MEDQVVAILHLREEQTLLAAGVAALVAGDVRRKRGQPRLTALQQVACGQRVGQFLQPRGVTKLQERVGGLLDALWLLEWLDQAIE